MSSAINVIYKEVIYFLPYARLIICIRQKRNLKPYTMCNATTLLKQLSPGASSRQMFDFLFHL